MTQSLPQVIRIAAAVILDADRRILLVRKRGTTAFMQPGGKMEDEEKPEVCLARELNEELGLHVDETQMLRLGDFAAPAANEEGATVEATLFCIEDIDGPSANAEIEEAVWLDPTRADDYKLAPLTKEVVIPLVLRMESST